MISQLIDAYVAPNEGMSVSWILENPIVLYADLPLVKDLSACNAQAEARDYIKT